MIEKLMRAQRTLEAAIVEATAAYESALLQAQADYRNAVMAATSAITRASDQASELVSEESTKPLIDALHETELQADQKRTNDEHLFD